MTHMVNTNNQRLTVYFVDACFLPHTLQSTIIAAGERLLLKAICGSQPCLERVNIKCSLERDACSLRFASFPAYEVGRAQSLFSFYLFFTIPIINYQKTNLYASYMCF